MKTALAAIGLAIVLFVIFQDAFYSKKEYLIPQKEYLALEKMINEHGHPTVDDVDYSVKMEDSTYIFLLSKKEDKITKIKKNTYNSETISPITAD